MTNNSLARAPSPCANRLSALGVRALTVAELLETLALRTPAELLAEPPAFWPALWDWWRPQSWARERMA